ncbi:MAG: hypothetical protein J0L62_15045 [Bacteroidetes bacterium]|nr:hypothetical protein [Bacteroidota bacterium]
MVTKIGLLASLSLTILFSSNAYSQELETPVQVGSIAVCGTNFLFKADKAVKQFSDFENEFQSFFIKGLAKQGKSAKIEIVNNLKDYDLTRSYVEEADHGFFFNLPTDLGFSRMPQSTLTILMFERGMIILKNADSLHLYAMFSGNYVKIDAKNHKVIQAGTISIKVKGEKKALSASAVELVNLMLLELFPSKDKKANVAETIKDIDDSGLKLGLILGNGSTLHLDFEEPVIKKTDYGQYSKEKLTVKDRFDNSNYFYVGFEMKLNSNIGLSYIYSKETMESNKSLFLFRIGNGYFNSENEKLETTSNAFNLTIRQPFSKSQKWNYLFKGGVLFRKFSGTGKMAGQSFKFGAKNTADIEAGFGLEFRPINPLWGIQLYGHFNMGTVTLNSLTVAGIKNSIEDMEYVNKHAGIKIGVFYDIMALRYR